MVTLKVQDWLAWSDVRRDQRQTDLAHKGPQAFLGLVARPVPHESGVEAVSAALARRVARSVVSS